MKKLSGRERRAFYDEYWHRRICSHSLSPSMIKVLELSQPMNGNLLGIGCGVGTFTRMVAEKTKKIPYGLNTSSFASALREKTGSRDWTFAKWRDHDQEIVNSFRLHQACMLPRVFAKPPRRITSDVVKALGERSGR